MIRCWLLNTMPRDFQEAFMYIKSLKELWDDVCEGCGMTNGPLVYQLKYEISNFKQGNYSITVYFNKLKKLSDELSSICENVECTCGAFDNCKCNLKEKLQNIETNFYSSSWV